MKYGLLKGNEIATDDVKEASQVNENIQSVRPEVLSTEPTLSTEKDPVAMDALAKELATSVDETTSVDAIEPQHSILIPTKELETSLDKITSVDHIEAQHSVLISDDENNREQETAVTNEPQADKSESSAVVCEVLCEVVEMDDSNIPEKQPIEMVTSNDEEDDSEMEIQSQPTPQNDVDMSDTAEDSVMTELTTSAKSILTYNFKNAPLTELSRYSWGADKQNYLRGCIFSPDGTCILTTVNKDGMHIVELPLSLYDNETVSPDRPLDVLTTAVHVRGGTTVYDYCWYPFMNSTMPDTCCFISTRQHEPLQLWDAFDGKLRCSYRGYDAVDEIEAALSVCFSSDGSQVIAGYKKSLKVFRTDVPGRDYTHFPLKSPAACLAVHSSDENVIAIGSWNGNVTLHDVRTPKLTAFETLVKHTGGVTLMKFSSDGKRLITGARKDNQLLGWDVRNETEPVFNLNRNVETNQTIYFDVNRSDEWLISGDSNGIVHAFDMECGTATGKFPDFQVS